MFMMLCITQWKHFLKTLHPWQVKLGACEYVLYVLHGNCLNRFHQETNDNGTGEL